MLDGPILKENAKTCYCEIGAGGPCCVSREHCEKFREAQRCRFNCRTAKENWIDGWKAAAESVEAINAQWDGIAAVSEDMLQKLAEYEYRKWKRE